MKKILSVVIGLLMMLTLLPIGAAAYVEDVVKIGNTDLESGYYLASVDGSPVAIGATTPASYVAMYQDGVLTLKDAVISTWYVVDFNDPINGPKQYEYGIFSESNLTVILQGDNVIGSDSDHPNYAAICSEGVLTVEGRGSLTAYGDYEALNSFAGIDIKSGDLRLFAEYPIDSYNNTDGTCLPLTISGGTITAEGYGEYSTGIYCGDVTISGGNITANGEDGGIYADGTLTVTGGTVTVNSDIAAIYATDIVLGSHISIRTGGTIRKTSVYTLDGDGPTYIKTVMEGGLTKYYINNTETTENACPAFPETESYHNSTFASGSNSYFDVDSGFVNASTEVVLGTRSTSSSDDDDDEPVITGKITSYEELSRLSDDYKAMKKYADTLGLGDFQVVGTWDIETKGFGPWKIVFHLDAKYLGDTLTIIHKKDDGTFETFTAVVDNSGEATITVTDASPFLVVRGEASDSTTGGTASVTEENPDTGFDFGWWF